MVFIKILKNIDNETKPLFCLLMKVIDYQTIMVFEKNLYIFENQTIIDYFINYRKQFTNIYSLQDVCQSLYQLRGKFTSEIDVQIQNFQMENQKEDQNNIEIIKGGKKLQMSIKKVKQYQQHQKVSILIVQHPLCINFYMLQNKEFIQIMELTCKDLIISCSIILEQQKLLILNEYNILEIYKLEFGYVKSDRQLIKRIDLNQYDQMFFKLTLNYIHGQKCVYNIQNDDQLIEFLKYLEVKDSQPTDLEQLDDRMSDFRNMKIYQLNKDSWVFIYKQFEHFFYSQNSIYKILDKICITTMIVSTYYYQKLNHVDDENNNDQEYLVQYQILIIAGLDKNQNKQQNIDNAYIKAYQYFQSSQLRCTMLIPILTIQDMKYEIDHLEFLGQYDILFKDIKGQVGIIQFTVEQFGQVLLQQLE